MNEIKDEIPNTESAPEPKTSSVQDWRGTPITVGAKVIYHYEYGKGLGKVVDFVTYLRWNGTPFQKLILEWESHSAHDRVRSMPIDSGNVTVLTKDMFDELF